MSTEQPGTVSVSTEVPSTVATSGEHSGKEERFYLFMAALLVFAAFWAGLLPMGNTYMWDEGVYLSDAENLVAANPYYSESSYRPPMLPVLLYAGSRLMPLELFAHLFGAACLAVAVLFLFLLGSRLYGRRAGLIAAGLMTLSPFFLHWTHKVMTDVPSTALAVVSIYLTFRSAEDEKPKAWMAALSGGLLAASALMRFVLVLAGVCAFSLFVARRLKFRSALWYLAGFAAMLAPYLIWARVRFGSFLRPFLEAMQFAGVGQVLPGHGADVLLSRFYYLEATYIVAAPAALVGLACYVYMVSRGARERWAWRDLPLILCYGIFLVYLTIGVHKEFRYILPAIPPLYLLAGRGLSMLPVKRASAVVAVIAVAAALFPLSHLRYFDGRKDMAEEYLLQRSAESRSVALYLQQTLPSGQVVYSSTLYPVLAYHSKRRTLALLPWDDSFYGIYPENMKEDGYLVFYRDVAKAPNEEWLEGQPEFRKIREFDNIVVYSYKRPPPDASPPDKAASPESP